MSPALTGRFFTTQPPGKPCVCVCTYKMKSHSAIRKKESLPIEITCIGLEGIMFSEINQREEDKYHMILLIHGI